jgi:hypothetical protein
MLPLFGRITANPEVILDRPKSLVLSKVAGIGPPWAIFTANPVSRELDAS